MEGPFLLLDVLLLVDTSFLLIEFDGFLLDEDPNLDWACLELEDLLLDGLGGGIKALAELCLCNDERELCSGTITNYLL